MLKPLSEIKKWLKLVKVKLTLRYGPMIFSSPIQTNQSARQSTDNYDRLYWLS